MRALRIVIAVCAATLVIGCGQLWKEKAASEAAVNRFHELYNGGRFEDVWKEADPRFRAASPKQDYDNLMDAMQRKLGKCVSTSNAGWNVSSFNLKTTVGMIQNTTFEHGMSKESFTFAVNGTNAVMVGYRINSIALATK